MAEYPKLLHTALDARDARGLAEFYRELLGLRYRPGDEPPAEGPDNDADWLVLIDADGNRVLAVQQVPELAAPTWPASHEVPKQLHQDFRVDTYEELERQRERAQAFGAVLLLDRSDDRDEPLYAFADPAGHPFCVMVNPG